MKLEIVNASCGYHDKNILNNISLTIFSGEFVCLLGPNGIGKTTFFKSLLGLLKLQSGNIFIDNENINKWTRQQFAKKISYVPQAHIPSFAYKVIDIVLMGRSAYLGYFSTPNKQDIFYAEKALSLLNINYLRNATYTEISGGERQLVLIARALAQETEFLIMDEPTANLDFGNQIQVLTKIKKLSHDNNLAVMMTTHAPDQAFICASKVVALLRNKKLLIGSPDKVITEDYLKTVYGVNVKITSYKSLNRKICIPIV